MANTINWLEPTNSLVGSVLIYKATSLALDNLGSRTLLTTTAAKSGGVWVTSYTDTVGAPTDLYRVQFWDGVGSSELSDVIGTYYGELLCTFDDVRRLARLKNVDIGSDEIYYAIKDATDTIFYEAGDPIKKSIIYLDGKTGVEGNTYNINGDYGPIYQIREVLVDSVYPRVVDSSYYDIDYANGMIKFTDGFSTTYQGKQVIIHWVPTTYHILAKNLAALELVQGEMVFNGTDVESPSVKRLKETIERVKDAIRPRGLYSTRVTNITTEYDVIAQLVDRTSLYFSN